MNTVKAPSLKLNCAVKQSCSSHSAYLWQTTRGTVDRKVVTCLGTRSVSTITDLHETFLKSNQMNLSGGGQTKASSGRPCRLPAGSTCFPGLYRPRIAPAPRICFPGSGKRVLQPSSAGSPRSIPKQCKRGALCESGSSRCPRQARPRGRDGGREGTGTCSVGPRPRAGTRGRSCLRLRT